MFNRQIFGPYFNGQTQVFCDPLAVYRKLHYLLGGTPEEYLREMKSEDPNLSYPAKEAVLQATRGAFGLQPFSTEDGSGAQDEDCWNILGAFLDFVSKKKVRPAN